MCKPNGITQLKTVLIMRKYNYSENVIRNVLRVYCSKLGRK